MSIPPFEKDSKLYFTKMKELSDNLGTIARSGTKKFVSKLSGDKAKDSNLIGQFGVGFYSSFMVADKVEVVSKKVGMNRFKWDMRHRGSWNKDPRYSYRNGPLVKPGMYKVILIIDLEEH